MTEREDPSDERLVALATAGQRWALERLLARHELWIFNLALYMLQARADAEDATQEVLVKIATNLATFQGDSRFRTWAHRVAVNHVIDRRRSRPEETVHGFGCYADYLDRAPDAEPPIVGGDSPAEIRVLVEEAKISCTMGLLLCLDREQRVAFVLGEVLETGDAAGGAALGISRESFRQRLARARQQLGSFLAGRCGLVDPRNPCRCARKTRAFVADGVVDPAQLQFAGAHVARVRAEAPLRSRALDVLTEGTRAALVGDEPLFVPPATLGARVRAVLGDPVAVTRDGRS